VLVVLVLLFLMALLLPKKDRRRGVRVRVDRRRKRDDMVMVVAVAVAVFGAYCSIRYDATTQHLRYDGETTRNNANCTQDSLEKRRGFFNLKKWIPNFYENTIFLIEYFIHSQKVSLIHELKKKRRSGRSGETAR